MKIDNSQCKTWLECPLKWKERYGNNLTPRDRNSDALDFGTRMHQLLELRHRAMSVQVLPHAQDFAPLLDAGLEAEAQLTLAAYEAYYPEEPFEVVGVERYFEVEIPRADCPYCHIYHESPHARFTCRSCEALVDPHTYCGEFDAIVRMKDSGRLWLLETKTEKRGGKDNHPEGWQQKSQVGLYLWAAQEVYGEEFEGILLNIITRQSPKGQERPSFRRDSLHRSRSQQRESIENLTWVADRIEECQRTGFFPSNRNNCVSPWGWKCDYAALHSTDERSEELVQIKYQQATPYLSGL